MPANGLVTQEARISWYWHIFPGVFHHVHQLGYVSAPPLPIKMYTTLVPTFARKAVFFSKVGANSRNQQKGVFFRHKWAKFLKRVNILHVSVCFHPGFHTLHMGRVFKYSFQIRRNAKYDVQSKDALCFIQLISLSQIGYFILYDENEIAFCFKKGCFIGPQNQRFRLKKGRVFFRPESAKRGCFPRLGTSVVYVLVGRAGFFF